MYRLEERPGLGLLMEKVNGGTLDQRLQKTEGLDAFQALYLSCFRGLERVHEAGIVHGDVIGRNIIVHGHDCVIIDFDKSRWVDSELLSLQRLADFGEIGLWIR